MNPITELLASMGNEAIQGALVALDEVSRPLTPREIEKALREHGVYAAKCGWTAADIFGLWPDKPHWGGIADRLRGARSLVMDADRASWRSRGQVERFNRGSYPHLRPFLEVRQ